MDIFFGSDQTISDDLLSKFKHFTELSEYHFIKASDKIFIHKHASGEVKCLNNEKYEIVFDGYFTGVTEAELVKKIFELAECIIKNKKIEHIVYNGLWNLIIYSKLSGDIFLTSDPSALLPLYYCIHRDSFYIGSHEYVLGAVLQVEPDFDGICQKLCFGYTIGKRTQYREINRINPGEIVFYNKNQGTLKSYYSNIYFAGDYSYIDIEEIIDSLNYSFIGFRKQYPEIGLMLSEGFDSRMLGSFAYYNGYKINTFTHCTYGTQGMKIAEHVSEKIKSYHHAFTITDGFPLEHNKLRSQLLLSDNLNLPYWIYGSEYFKEMKIPVMVGTALDSTLGGHAFYMPIRPYFKAVKQRYSEIILQDLGIITAGYVENLSNKLLENLGSSDRGEDKRKISQSFSRDIANAISDRLNNIKSHLETEFERLKSTGSTLPSQMLQRFFMEHRARKYAFGQELTLRINNKIFIPSYHYSYIHIASRINPVRKLHHKLYLKVLYRHNQALLKVPNGAYGIPAVYPRIILETSRFLHKKKEKNQFRELLRSHGSLDPSNFRSCFVSDYSIRNKNKLDEFRYFVNKNRDIFNQEGFDEYLNKVEKYKIRTFNHDSFYRALEICQVIKGNF